MTIFTCNICDNAATRYIESLKTTVTEFNVAENYQGGDGKRLTQFYRVAIFGSRGAKMEEYLKKGRSITLQGRVKPGAYINKENKAVSYLQLTNPMVTFNTANPTAEVDAVTELPADATPFVPEDIA